MSGQLGMEPTDPGVTPKLLGEGAQQLRQHFVIDVSA
jgi:hypothetical protein